MLERAMNKLDLTRLITAWIGGSHHLLERIGGLIATIYLCFNLFLTTNVTRKIGNNKEVVPEIITDWINNHNVSFTT